MSVDPKTGKTIIQKRNCGNCRYLMMAEVDKVRGLCYLRYPDEVWVKSFLQFCRRWDRRSINPQTYYLNKDVELRY